MISKSYASVLAEDFINKHGNTSSINEFRKTPHHYKIWLLILQNFHIKKETTMESIIIYLAKDSSRKTVSAILVGLEEKKLLIRKKSLSDHRVILVEPAEQTVKEFKEWIHHLKFELNSVEE